MFVVVYDYIPGAQLKTFTITQLVQVGAFLGRFHTRTKGFRWHGTRKQFYHLPDARVDHIVRFARRRHVPFQQELPDIAREVKRWKLNPQLPKGPIHVDVKPENVLYQGGRLSGVIDFDNCYHGPLILDLMTTMVWFGLIGRTFNLRHAAAVYRGYRRVRRLTPLEYRELYRVFRFKFVSHVFVDYEMRAKRVIGLAYLSWLVHNLYWAYRHLAITEKQFYRTMPR